MGFESGLFLGGKGAIDVCGKRKSIRVGHTCVRFLLHIIAAITMFLHHFPVKFS